MTLEKVQLTDLLDTFKDKKEDQGLSFSFTQNLEMTYDLYFLPCLSQWD